MVRSHHLLPLQAPLFRSDTERFGLLFGDLQLRHCPLKQVQIRGHLVVCPNATDAGNDARQVRDCGLNPADYALGPDIALGQ